MGFFRSQRRIRLALLFAGLFLTAVFAQIGVGFYQRHATARKNLREGVKQILGLMTYSTRWDLNRLRQSDNVLSYSVIDKSDLILDIEGFFPELAFKVDPTNLQPGLQTKIVQETNENWRIQVQQVKGGMVILGISPPEDITRIDEHLQDNAKRFGNSLKEAEKIRSSDVETYINYIVLDDGGHVKFAIGGIPLKLIDYPKLPFGVIKEIRLSKGRWYGLLAVPFLDASGQRVGTVTVFDEIPPPPWRSLDAWLMNLSVSLILAFVGTSIGARYIQEPFRPEQLLQEALQSGESSTIEFKEALRWEAQQDRPGDPRRYAEGIAIKAVAGFLNNRMGGTLFIGIADDKRIVGLKRDYESLVNLDQVGLDKARDQFQLRLRKVFGDTIGAEVGNVCVETAIIQREGKDLCVVRVSPSLRPVYVPEAKGKVFYLRHGPATVRLDVEEAVAYCQKRWPLPLWARFRLWTRTP